MNGEPLENPVFGYVVISVALIVGLLSATVFSQPPLLGSGHEANLRHQSRATLSLRESPQRMEESRSNESDSHRSCSRPRRWILGIRSTPTSAGCVITAVIQGSAAEKAGLTVGDRVITVDGEQVGWIGRQLVPIHRAVDAALSGKSRLLIQNSVSGSFRSIPIRLQTVEETLGHRQNRPLR